MRCRWELRMPVAGFARLVGAAALLALVAGCSQDSRSASWEQQVSTIGTVKEIDRPNRRMVVQVGWHRLTVRVSPAVERFDNRRVGDRIRVDYLKAVVAAVEPADGRENVDVTRYHLSAPDGEKPGIAHLRVRQYSAEFIDYDYQSSLTTFKTPGGEYRQLLIPTRMRRFVRTLKLGDPVVVSVEQAIAVSVAATK